MLRRLIAPLALAGSLMLSGCYLIDMTPESSKPVLLNRQGAQAGHFKHDERVSFMFWGLVNSNPSLVKDTMARYRTKTVKGYNVSTQQDALSIILGIVTLGIYTSVPVSVEGYAQ